MKFTQLSTGIVSAFLLAGASVLSAGQVLAAESHHHHADHATAATEATPPAGQLWQADEPLMAGMRRVRTAGTELAHLEHGALEPARTRELAVEIQAAVNDMFANCKLAPEPDAALHPLLARLLTASQALQDKPTDAAPVAEVHAVLERYPQMFDDKEWASTGHQH